MVIGAVYCPTNSAQRIAKNIRDIKQRFTNNPAAEIKWTKLSPSNQNYYQELVDYFFEENELCSRIFVVPDKSKLNHELFNQSHDDYYYKIYYNMLKHIIDPHEEYFIYLDIKDTRSAKKVRKLKDVLVSKFRNQNHEIIRRLQSIKSHETELMQLADLLIGAVSYKNRDLSSSPAKVNITRHISERSGHTLVDKTSVSEKKMSIFIWDAAEARG